MQLSKDFSFSELTKTDSTDLQARNRAEAVLSYFKLRRVARELLQPIRDGIGQPITISSGYRGKTLNELVRGSATSQHCKGEAVDFWVRGYDSRAGQLQVMRWVQENGIKFGQLLIERGCIHISLPRGVNDGEVAEYVVATKAKTPLDLASMDIKPIIKGALA